MPHLCGKSIADMQTPNNDEKFWFTKPHKSFSLYFSVYPTRQNQEGKTIEKEKIPSAKSLWNMLV